MDALPISAARRPLGRSALCAFPFACGLWRHACKGPREARGDWHAILVASQGEPLK